jgi:hypothetical protein
MWIGEIVKGGGGGPVEKVRPVAVRGQKVEVEFGGRQRAGRQLGAVRPGVGGLLHQDQRRERKGRNPG